MVERARLESECVLNGAPGVRIPLSPPEKTLSCRQSTYQDSLLERSAESTPVAGFENFFSTFSPVHFLNGSLPQAGIEAFNIGMQTVKRIN